MAIDVYLQIDGIKGESQDDKHKDWIEVTGVHWGIHQPRSATASTGGGHTAEPARSWRRPAQWVKRSLRPIWSSSARTAMARE
jgi:type VI protein secretion system component Hcp